jgi:hypothetical protein
LFKTAKDAICGGYTSVNWDFARNYRADNEAFVFNMIQKYTPND